jgi:hypothetical protein
MTNPNSIINKSIELLRLFSRYVSTISFDFISKEDIIDL